MWFESKQFMKIHNTQPLDLGSQQSASVIAGYVQKCIQENVFGKTSIY